MSIAQHDIRYDTKVAKLDVFIFSLPHNNVLDILTTDTQKWDFVDLKNVIFVINICDLSEEA